MCIHNINEFVYNYLTEAFRGSITAAIIQIVKRAIFAPDNFPQYIITQRNTFVNFLLYSFAILSLISLFCITEVREKVSILKQSKQVIKKVQTRKRLEIKLPVGHSEILSLEMTVTLWVLGGPGSGKGTQCERIVKKYGFLHLSSGDLLREEVASGSPRGGQLQELMSQGLFVPSDIVLSLIKERINKGKVENVPGFLIDGYPRELSQGLEFEKEIGPVDLVLFFDVENETLTKRLLGRAASSGRADDNETTIKKRIEVFNEKNGPVIEHYKEKVVKINAEGAVEDIFAEASRAIDAVHKV